MLCGIPTEGSHDPQGVVFRTPLAVFFCLRFFDITLMSFYCVFFSFLGIDVPLGIFSCTQRRLPFPSFPFSRTVCLVSSEGSHDPRGLIPDRSFALFLIRGSSTTLIDLFFRLLHLRSVPPRPPARRFRWKDMVESLICVSFFCGCMMIGYAGLRCFCFHFSFFFQLSTARVRHVPIRMVSSN